MDALFDGAVHGEAAADDEGHPGDLPVAEDGDDQARERHRHGQPLKARQPLPEHHGAQQDGQNGVHVIGQAGVQHMAAVDGPDIGPPVDAHENTRQGQAPQLPPVPQHGPDGAEAPPHRQDGGDKHQRPHDAASQNVQGVHRGQQLPENRQDAPEDITRQYIQRAPLHTRHDLSALRGGAARKRLTNSVLFYVKFSRISIALAGLFGTCTLQGNRL